MNTLRDRLRIILIPPVLLVAFLLVDVFISWPAIVDVRHLLSGAPLSWLAMGMGTLSLSVVIASLRQLVRQQTTFNALQSDKTQTLITDGCYALSRNPVYLGFVGLQLSAALLLSTLSGVLITPLLMALLTVLHIQVEEVQMQRIFGHEWATYCNKTRRWL
ncbi:isoprenylcysteine carboxylmethyltransferase family protein [Kosakonia sp. BK9b]